MLDQEFPDDVMKLRPRKLRLGREVERLLEGVCGAEEDSGRSRDKQALRPSAESANAIRCAACGKVEYITREYCRCGHYLVGQIEDEYFAYERGLVEAHKVELSRICAAPSARLGHLAFEGQGAFASQC